MTTRVLPPKAHCCFVNHASHTLIVQLQICSFLISVRPRGSQMCVGTVPAQIASIQSLSLHVILLCAISHFVLGVCIFSIVKSHFGTKPPSPQGTDSDFSAFVKIQFYTTKTALHFSVTVLCFFLVRSSSFTAKDNLAKCYKKYLE